MTKPPSKPRTEPRARTAVAKQTMLEQLLANVQAYDDDEIKVWVQAYLPDHPKQFDDSLEKHLEETGFFSTCHELLQVSEGASLSPGQYFLIIRATSLKCITMELGRVSQNRPELVFEGVTFTVYGSHMEYDDAKVGNPRPFAAAARRALQETGGQDWFGGISEFASKYLQPPQKSRRPILH